MRTPRTRLAAFFPLLGLLAAPLAAGTGPTGYLVGVGGSGGTRDIYLADFAPVAAVVSGPFLTGTFAGGFQLTVLRDAPAAIVHAGSQLYRVDFSNPAAPAVVDTATLPFAIHDLARLSATRDELVAVGDGGELAVIDPATLDIRASFLLQSERLLVRPSPDGRLLLTGGGGSGIFLSTFNPVLGIGTEVSLAGMSAGGFGEAAFSPDGRTLVLHDNFCWGSLLGPPFCETYLVVFDISDPAIPVGTEDFTPGIDLVTSSVLDRSGERFYFHQRGNHKWAETPSHRLLPFEIAGAGDLTSAAPIVLTASGDFQASGVVRSAGAKELLVCTSETDIPDPPMARLHRLTLSDNALADSPLPVPLEPRGVVYPGAAVFADGFESGGTGNWG